MRINLSPLFTEDPLTVSKQGDALTINGEVFDFSDLPDGATIQNGYVTKVIPCDWIVGPVSRIDGELHLTLVLPHGPNPSQAVAFPDPIADPADGEIQLPRDPEPEEEDHVEA
ncbi:hypothetical protein [Chelativorans sp. J32]|uniref:hypothetical protein n=1 Tax=Chelativorans sp. J32 TaxID=935840 RepID=UPI0004855FE6|nr:hypothetical protein [Chelativorans sp. J32]